MMRILLFTYDCAGCGRCVARCPAQVLKLVGNDICRFVNVEDEARCVVCGICERVCPRHAIKLILADEW